MQQAKTTTFSKDLELLKKYTDVVVLSDTSGKAQVAVAPAWQGRVMTSTADGLDGSSFGWLNQELITSGKKLPHMNAYGGEDRFWMGPEGGQFALYFDKGVPFDYDHWQVPAFIDTEPFDVVTKNKDSVSFRRQTILTNYSGTKLDVLVDRIVRMLSREQVAGLLGVSVPQKLKMVAYESENKITNVGDRPWQKETGAPSIWMLSMFAPSTRTTIVIPFNSGPESELGPKVNDTYFGKVPAERLIVKDNVLFFSGDGTFRSKIGLPPRRAKSLLGSYDAVNQVLTIIQYNKPAGVTDYVNSMWEIQKQPYAGDVVNSYNDGPAQPGAKAMGPFYEMETSSPAAVLKPSESITHINHIIHLQGSEDQLDKIATATLGVTLKEIKSAF